MSAADGLATLLEIQATPEFQRDGQLWLESAAWVDRDLRLALTVWTGHPRRVAQRWELDCRSVHDHRLRLGRCDRFAVASEHVLLWPYSQPRVQTYFVDPTPGREVGAVVGALYRRHAELVGGWFGFERFMNRGGLAWVLGLRAGSLAYGPAPLTLAYAEVLGSLVVGGRGFRRGHASGRRPRAAAGRVVRGLELPSGQPDRRIVSAPAGRFSPTEP